MENLVYLFNALQNARYAALVVITIQSNRKLE